MVMWWTTLQSRDNLQVSNRLIVIWEKAFRCFVERWKCYQIVTIHGADSNEQDEHGGTKSRTQQSYDAFSRLTYPSGSCHGDDRSWFLDVYVGTFSWIQLTLLRRRSTWPWSGDENFNTNWSPMISPVSETHREYHWQAFSISLSLFGKALTLTTYRQWISVYLFVVLEVHCV